MSLFILDTNIVSSLIRDRAQSPVLKRIAEVGPPSVCTSVIVVAEIRYGVSKRGSKQLEAEADRVLATLESVSFEHPADRLYATIRTDLEQRGLTIGANDLFIAAHCLALDATLVTNNTREFERVRGLRIEDWLS